MGSFANMTGGGNGIMQQIMGQQPTGAAPPQATPMGLRYPNVLAPTNVTAPSSVMVPQATPTPAVPTQPALDQIKGGGAVQVNGRPAYAL